MCIAFYIIFAYVCRRKTTKPSIVISLIIIILFLELQITLSSLLALCMSVFTSLFFPSYNLECFIIQIFIVASTV